MESRMSTICICLHLISAVNGRPGTARPHITCQGRDYASWLGALCSINVETRLPCQAVTAKHIWIFGQQAPAFCPHGSLCAEETADLDRWSVSLCHP